MVQAGGLTIGPSSVTIGTPESTSVNKQKWYVSDYVGSPGPNTLVVGDEIVNFVGDVALESSGTAITEMIANGQVIADAGETTWAAKTIKIIAPSSNPKLNLLILASDENKSGADRCVNMNTANEDGSIDRYFSVVLAAKPIKKAGSTLAGWEITYQPFGVDRRILTAV